MSTKILNEVSKRYLLDNSKRDVDDYEDQSKGKNRYQRRSYQKIANSNREFNLINMNNLFKDDELKFNIQVRGETDNYLVTLLFNGVLDELQKLVEPALEIDLRTMMRAVASAFENNDVKVRCTCPDFQYRISYYLSLDDAISGEKENRPSDITNPEDTKGKGCKHILKVLNNTSWINKIASVIRNYINYMKEHKQSMYAKVIYPAVYGQPYDEQVLLGLFDDQDMETDTDTIDNSNKYARTKNQFKPLPNNLEKEQSVNVPGQKSFDFDSLANDDEEQR